MRAETMTALQSSAATLAAKAPADLEAYRQLVLGVSQAVAAAKGGETAVETAMIAEIRTALGGA
jgi:tellurite resistance protein